MKKNLFNSDTIKIAKIMIGVLLAYVLILAGIYLIAGDAFKYRDSRSNVEMPAVEANVVELTYDTVIEEHFSALIHRYDTISVIWGTYYNRPNVGTAKMELITLSNGAVVLSKTFDVSALKDGDVVSMSFDPSDPMREAIVNERLCLRLSANSEHGYAVTPMMSSVQTEGRELFVNGERIAGTLCFSATGTDYIWIGTNYWTIVGISTAVFALILAGIWLIYANGRKSYVITAVKSFAGYSFLIKQLVARDFKRKYKRSVLGVLWSFINPLLSMLVQFFVFSNLFRTDVENYPAYLLIGVITFSFFSESCSMALNAITGNTSLIKKVYVPKYIYPLTSVMSSMVNFGISLIPLLIVCVLTGVKISLTWILSLFFFLCLAIFCLGLGLLLSSSMVFFRDTQFIWGVLSLMWMYATPIFWTENILPPQYGFLFKFNPLYSFLKNVRVCILNGISPEPFVYLQCVLLALGMLLVGAIVFKKTQDKFIMYV